MSHILQLLENRKSAKKNGNFYTNLIFKINRFYFLQMNNFKDMKFSPKSRIGFTRCFIILKIIYRKLIFSTVLNFKMFVRHFKFFMYEYN